MHAAGISFNYATTLPKVRDCFSCNRIQEVSTLTVTKKRSLVRFGLTGKYSFMPACLYPLIGLTNCR